jgi:hypothetical protein
MKIIEVLSRNDQKEFLKIPHRVYKDDPNWVCPLNPEVEAIFDPKKNNFHSHGEITRWIITDDQGIGMGRIAAFINQKKAFGHELPTGGMGFYECVQDLDISNTLFNTATNWLKSKGMMAAEAPINFGENDSFWGLLIEGFTAPFLGMNYNPPYYQSFFENYGFVKSYDQISNTLYHKRPFPERFTKIAEWVSKKPGYTFEHLHRNQFSKFAADFKEIYNDAWKNFDHFVPVTDATILETFQKMEPIMDEKLIWFAYVNGEPASFVIIIPDANVWIKSLKGNMNLWGKIQFVWNRYTIKPKRMRAIVMGTKTAYQKHGLESVLFIKLGEYVLPKNQYEELELSWVGDFNEKMIALHAAMNTDFGKRHRTYCYTFPQ